MAKASAANYGSFTAGGLATTNWAFYDFDKDRADDLTPDQRKALKQMLKRELDQRYPEKR